MPVTDIESIKKLYEKLKSDRVVVTWEEFSVKLKYGRTYISRVINGHVPLTPEIINRINSTDFYSTKNVSRETIGDESGIRPLYTIEELKKKIEEQWQVIKSQQETIHMIAKNAPPGINDASKNY